MLFHLFHACVKQMKHVKQDFGLTHWILINCENRVKQNETRYLFK
ncbi:ribosomal protein L39E [Mucilaginibacter sp. UYCu711]